MKNVILAFSALLAFTTASFAQNAPAAAPTPEAKTNQPKGRGKEHGKEMSEHGKAQGEKGKGQMEGNLGLSAEQEVSFKALNTSHKDAMKAVNMDKSLTADAKAAKVSELKSKYEADVKGVMNADQYAKWTASRAKRTEKAADHKEKMGEHKAKMGDKKMQGKAKSDKVVQPQGAVKSE